MKNVVNSTLLPGFMTAGRAKLFLTPREIAALLKLNPLTIYSYIKKKYLPAVRFGRSYRIEKKDLDTFIQKNKTS